MIWSHIFTPFDTWWPNIEGAVVWGLPAVATWLWQHRKLVVRDAQHAVSLAAAQHKLDALHAKADVTHEKLDALHAKVDTEGSHE